MTLTLELPPEIEQALQAAAQAEGHDPADYATQVLAWHLAPVAALRRAGRLNSTASDATTNPARTSNGTTSADNRTVAARKLELLDEWESDVASRPDYRAQAGLGPLPDDAIEAAYHAREDPQL